MKEEERGIATQENSEVQKPHSTTRRGFVKGAACFVGAAGVMSLAGSLAGCSGTSKESTNGKSKRQAP